MFVTLFTRNRAPIASRSHVKSRGGCRTCKDRKVKCDERRPICGNCSIYFTDAIECNFGELAALVTGRKASARIRARLAQPQKQSAAEGEAGNEKANTVLPNVKSHSNSGLRLPRSIDEELLDPFMTYPASSETGVDTLLKHYFTTAIYMTFPWQAPSKINPTVTYYAPLVYADKVLFRTILQHTAVQLEVLGSKCTRVLSQRLMVDCLSLLQDRIQDPDHAVSNETLAAIANLAAIEHLRGNVKALHSHVEGLRRMVAIRGGMMVLRRECAMVANAVFWIFVVSMYETPFLSPDPESYGDIPQWLLVAKEQYRDVPQLEFHSLGLVPSVATVLSDVRVLSQRYTLPSTYSSPMEAAAVLTHLCIQLHRILSQPLSNTSSSLASVASEACRHAIAIHVFSPWRGLHPDPTLAIKELLHSLKVCLRQLTTSSMNQVLLLWLLAVGGVAASDVPKRQWFTSHLAFLVADMELKTWEGMRSQLIKVIWHQRLCEDSHRKLWYEVVRKQKDLNIYDR